MGKPWCREIYFDDFVLLNEQYVKLYNLWSVLRRVIEAHSHYFHRELKTEVEEWKSETCVRWLLRANGTLTHKWGWEMRKNSLRIAVSVGLFKKTSFRNFGLSCEHIKTTVSDSCGCALKPQSSRETFAWPGGWEGRVCWYFQYRLAPYHHIHLGHVAVFGSCLQALSCTILL